LASIFLRSSGVLADEAPEGKNVRDSSVAGLDADGDGWIAKTAERKGGSHIACVARGCFNGFASCATPNIPAKPLSMSEEEG
jgi:hypothetical protein